MIWIRPTINPLSVCCLTMTDDLRWKPITCPIQTVRVAYNTVTASMHMQSPPRLLLSQPARSYVMLHRCPFPFFLLLPLWSQRAFLRGGPFQNKSPAELIQWPVSAERLVTRMNFQKVQGLWWRQQKCVNCGHENNKQIAYKHWETPHRRCTFYSKITFSSKIWL